VLSETLIGAFEAPDLPAGSEDPIELMDYAKNSVIDLPEQAVNQSQVSNDEEASSDKSGGALDQLSAEVEGAFADLVEDNDIAINGNETWVEISLNSNLLFASGSAQPNPEAMPILAQIASILSGYKNPVHVEGFTDNVPIESAVFPSNWELSAARSATVVRLLAESGVDPDRLAAVGYGEYQPMSSNDTAEGRSDNRRVVLVVSKDTTVRHAISGIDDAQSGERLLDLDEVNDDSTFLKEKELVKTIELEGGGLLFTQGEDGE